MAVLQPTDYNTLRDAVYRVGDGKEELKALAALPDESKLLAIFQAIEDRVAAAFVLAKADIEVILGVPISATFMRKLGRAWLRWRDRIGG